MCAHNKYGTVRCSGLDVDQPLLYLVNSLFAVHNLPENEVEGTAGEEVLVGGVVLLLPTEVPRSEHHGSKVLVLVPRFLLIGPVTIACQMLFLLFTRRTDCHICDSLLHVCMVLYEAIVKLFSISFTQVH